MTAETLSPPSAGPENSSNAEYDAGVDYSEARAPEVQDVKLQPEAQAALEALENPSPMMGRLEFDRQVEQLLEELRQPALENREDKLRALSQLYPAVWAQAEYGDENERASAMLLKEGTREVIAANDTFYEAEMQRRFADKGNPTIAELEQAFADGDHITLNKLREEKVWPDLDEKIEEAFWHMVQPLGPDFMLGAPAKEQGGRMSRFVQRAKERFLASPEKYVLRAAALGGAAIVGARIITAIQQRDLSHLDFSALGFGDSHDVSLRSNAEASSPLYDPEGPHVTEIPMEGGQDLQLPEGYEAQNGHLFYHHQPVAELGADGILSAEDQQKLLDTLKETPGVEAEITQVNEHKTKIAEPLELDHREWWSGTPEGQPGGNEFGLSVSEVQDGKITIKFTGDGLSWLGGEHLDPQKMDLEAVVVDKNGNAVRIPLNDKGEVQVQANSDIGHMLEEKSYRKIEVMHVQQEDGQATGQIFATELNSRGSGTLPDNASYGSRTIPGQPELQITGEPQPLSSLSSAEPQPGATATTSTSETTPTQKSSEGLSETERKTIGLGLAAVTAAAGVGVSLLAGARTAERRPNEPSSTPEAAPRTTVQELRARVEALPPDARVDQLEAMVAEVLGSNPTEEQVRQLEQELNSENFPYKKIEINDGQVVVSDARAGRVRPYQVEDWLRRPERRVEMAGQLNIVGDPQYRPSDLNRMAHDLTELRNGVNNARFLELLSSVGLSEAQVFMGADGVSVRPSEAEAVANALNSLQQPQA